jgi:hypothetical protein
LELLVWKALEAVWLEPLEWTAEQVWPLAQLLSPKDVELQSCH